MDWRAWPDRLSTWITLAAGIGLLDLSVALWTAPPEFAFLPTVLRALSLSTALAAVALAAARLACAPFARRMAWPVTPLVGAAVAWAWLVLLLAAPSNRLLSLDACQGDQLVCGGHLSRLMPPALAVAPAFFLAARALAASRGGARSTVGRTTAVPLLALAVAAQWYVDYGNHPRGLHGTWPALVGFVVLAAALVLTTARWRLGGALATTVNVAVVAVVVLGPAWLPLWAFARDRASGGAARGGAPDLVLLVTADALRADAVSYDLSGHTPNLARLAREGTVFPRAISPSSWTLPTFGSWLTGLSPDVHLVDVGGRLPAAAITLPQLLRQAGYVTGAIVENPLFAPPSDFASRFDDATPLMQWAGAVPRTAMSLGPRVWSAIGAAGDHDGSASSVTRLALRWLRRVSTGRAFLWVHYLDPHAPYSPATGARSKADATAGPARSEEYRAYLGEVVQVDAEIGRLLDGVRELGRYDRALIIFTSDHGEELGERGETGHGRNLHREVVEVPLVVKLPGVRTGRVVATRVSTQALFSTVLDVCRVPDRSPSVESPSLLALARGETGGEPLPEPISWLVRLPSGRVRPRAALYDGNFKYVRLFDPDEERVFELSADPNEMQSVADEYPEVVEEGRMRLARERERAAIMRKALRVVGQDWNALDPDRIRALRSLGYVQ